MDKITKQMENWMACFGKEYTDRNLLNLKELDELYQKKYGITRTHLNRMFIGDLDKSLKILEIGSNIGSQLLNLQKMGFKNIYGIEINRYAVETAKARTKNIDIIQGSAFDIPSKDAYFDLVFTSGVLIHINPEDIKKAMKEIYRCAGKYIWGFEYYSEEYKEIIYRDEKNLLWKANFPQIYVDTFPDLKIMKIKSLKYLDNDNIDVMFLLRKQNV